MNRPPKVLPSGAPGGHGGVEQRSARQPHKLQVPGSNPGPAPVNELLLVLLVCGAVCRISRLIAVDEFPPMVGIRERVAGRWGDGSWQAYLSECPWCVSVYVGAAVVGAVCLTVDGGCPAPLLVWPVTSMFTGAFTVWEDK